MPKFSPDRCVPESRDRFHAISFQGLLYLSERAPGPCFNIKTIFSRYRDSHDKDKTVSWPSFIYNGNSYAGMMPSLYLDSPLMRWVWQCDLMHGPETGLCSVAFCPLTPPTPDPWPLTCSRLFPAPGFLWLCRWLTLAVWLLTHIPSLP